MAKYNCNHYDLPFSHIMIIVIISDEDIFTNHIYKTYSWEFSQLGQVNIQQMHYTFLVNKNEKGKGEQTCFIVASPIFKKKIFTNYKK